MSINPDFISSFWIVISVLGYGLVLFLAVRSAEWWRLRDQHDLNVLICAILGILFIWILKADYASSRFAFGLNLHLLGATLLTLMFGWSFAVIAMSLVITTVTIIHGDSLLALSWNILLTGILPISISYRIFRFADRRLPNNFFIYIFICTFFGAALSMASVIFATTAFHTLSGAFSFEYLGYNYFQYGLLLMFPEAFITGMLMSIFVVYRPQWVSTFDDHRYLHKH
ncbi:MAG: energy-coupling factor ABC transporter permease [Thioalkalispiraceae bacterium]|jgi:uncharacterized membrane protein